jgi:hypothetical protein
MKEGDWKADAVVVRRVAVAARGSFIVDDDGGRWVRCR